ncbi:hypothetical protein [Mucisphaera calidilacus]|uniref:Uncharacterized protein n=1 Tax=Mucisphaera calidilacus TaxID=2527982 RepID=A0A518BZG1_9BACT|nr:hypothetical protein [Mucisphaera calidilacus]QDU72355.1 hypothetical protein Pan265_22200 [Mucisphaera calidilacus]
MPQRVDQLAYPSTRRDWPAAGTLLVLPWLPWVALNRGAHRWGWITSLVILIAAIPCLPFWYFGDAVTVDDRNGIVIAIFLASVIQAGLVTPWVRHDGSNMVAFGIALRRVWLAAPFAVMCAWLCLASISSADALMAFIDRQALDAEQRGNYNPQTYNGLKQALSALRPFSVFASFLAVTLMTHVMAHAARPGWSSRWPGHCEACDYTLLALPYDANCPECGREVRRSLFSTRWGGDRAARTLWQRGQMATFQPTAFGRHVILRGPEPIPWRLYSLLLAILALLGTYVAVVILSPTIQISNITVVTPTQLLNVLSLHEQFSWNANPIANLDTIILLGAFSMFNFGFLLSLLCFSAIIAERASGKRGFAAVRQSLCAVPLQWAIATAVAMLLLLWGVLATIPWLNPFVMILAELREAGINVPEALVNVADTAPYYVFALYTLIVFAWFTYAAARTARAARYANG